MQSIVSISRTHRTQIQCVCTSDQMHQHIRVNLLVGERAYGLVHIKMQVWTQGFSLYPGESLGRIESRDYNSTGIYIKRHTNGYSMCGYHDSIAAARFTADEFVDILRVIETAIPSAAEAIKQTIAWV